MASAELMQSWARTTAHLEAARALLPPNAGAGPEGATLAGYQDYLDHNELELALDQLADVGKGNSASPDFWLNLSKAAGNMKLDGRARQLQHLAEAS